MSKVMKKVWLTGANGQLGTTIQKLGKEWDIEFILTTHQDLDLTSTDAVAQFYQQHKPDFLINTVAFTNVDAAENQPEAAKEINTDIALNLARLAECFGMVFIHIGTDHIFGGFGNKRTDAYREEDQPIPANVYGLTKYLADFALQSQSSDLKYYILRTSWLYAPQDWARKNFYKSILQAGLRGDSLRVVEDEVGTPTSTLTLARVILSIIEDYGTDKQLPLGTYHIADKGEVSRYDFAREILKLNPRTQAVEINPCLQSDLDLPAKRPHYSALDTTKIQEYYPELIRPWHEALREVYDIDNR